MSNFLQLGLSFYISPTPKVPTNIDSTMELHGFNKGETSYSSIPVNTFIDAHAGLFS